MKVLLKQTYWLWSLFFMLTINVMAQNPFQQDSGSDGIVCVEAENNDDNISQGGKTWTSATSTSGYSGASYMIVLPNTGSNIEGGYQTNCPRLDFEVNFVKTGTHYIWLRGNVSSGQDNSLHVGLNGSTQSNSNNMDYPSDGTWPIKIISACLVENQ